jgi:putative peptidoglycan lipid II flippase
MMLRVPLVSALYQRNKFDAHDVQLVAWALLWYAAGLVGHSIMEILTRAFYAQHDTKTPVIIGTVAMGLNVLFSFMFSALFERIGWLPLGGLALANSLATALEAAALFIFMRRRLNGIAGRHIARGLVRCGGAALGMAAGLWFWIQATGGMNRWVIALGGVLFGAILYFGGTLLFKVPEVQMMIGLIASRLRRSPTS